MAQTPKQMPTLDPDNVQETFVSGPINCNISGAVALLTFTNVRANADDLLRGKGDPELTAIVRSRLIMPIELLVNLRNLLNQMISDAAPSSGSTH
jgi:hypothetical protein